jgi:Na+-driven multidrug efflux pump
VNDDDLFIKKLYTRCMFASMLALSGNILGQITSAIIAGRFLESGALPVMAIALPVQALFSVTGALLGVGGTVLCARAIGDGLFEECHRIFTVVYVLDLLVAALLAFMLLPLADPIVRFLGVDSGLFRETKAYISILISGGVFSMSIYPAYNFLRLDGRSGASIIVFFAQAAITISLDLLFLVVFRRGVEAVALATITGAAVSGLGGAVLLFLFSKNFHFTPSIFRKMYRSDILRIAGRIFAAGSPSATESLCILGYSIVLNRLIARSFGVFALSSFKLIDSVNSFALVFIFAVSGPIIQFVGVFGAEKDSKSIRQLLTQVFKWGVLFIFGYLVLCEIFAPQLAGFFGMASPETLAAAVMAIRIFALSLVPALVNNILIAVYQAESRAFLANVLTVSRLFLWIVIAAPLLSSRFGVIGVWHSFWIAESLCLVSALTLSPFYYLRNRRFSPLFLVDREAELTGVYKSFSVKNDPESITQSSAGIAEFCELNKLGSKLTLAISLAIEEILVLIRGQSLAGDDEATMNVRVLIEEHTVILRVRNGGKNSNPIDYAKKSEETEEVEVMGIKMLLALALNIDYRNTFGVNNTTILLERRDVSREHA